MVKVKTILCLIVFTSCLIIIDFNSPLNADPMISYPGTRAKGMGGAFTGIADDSSSVWYNPAGLGLTKSRYENAFEWSQTPGRKLKRGQSDPSKKFDDGELTNNGNNLFISFTGIYLGFFYCSPYSMDWKFSNKEKLGTELAQIHERIRMLGLAFAFPVLKDRISLGVTIEHVKHTLGHLEYDENGKSKLDHETSKISGSFGILAVPLDLKQYGIKFKLGGVYHLKSESSNTLLGKPLSYDFGASVTKSFTSLKSSFLFSIQHGFTQYDAVNNDYNKTSFGAEWSIVPQQKLPLCISFRTGYYTSNATEKERGWPDVNAFTAGIGLLLSDGIPGLEFAYENRNLSYYTDEEESVSIISLSVFFIGKGILK